MGDADDFLERKELVRQFGKAQLNESKEYAHPYPDVSVGETLYSFEAGDDLYYSTFLVTQKDEDGLCIVIEFGNDQEPVPLPRYAGKRLHRTLREAMETAINWDLGYFTMHARLCEEFLQILKAQNDPCEALTLIREASDREHEKWDELNGK